MKRLLLLVFIAASVFMGVGVRADDTDLFMAPVKPNVLIIVDNSNSMDEDFYGNAVGSFSPESKSVVGKKALKTIIDSYKKKLRVGLMSYNISGVSAYYIHNAPEFVSYEPKSYCPNPPPQCVQYAQTGDLAAKAACSAACKADNPSFDVDYFDEILNNYTIGSEPRTRYSNLVYPHNQKKVNPSDPSNFMYFKHAYPFYAPSNYGSVFCYGTGYSPNEGSPWDSYTCWSSKTGTTDDDTGYSGSSFGITLVPTDSDYALGYADFGMRLSWYYAGQTWFASGSRGNGYLHVQVDDLTDRFGVPTATYANVWNKLDPKENDEAGYMSCGLGDKNTCSYIVNSGLTPTAGTFQEANNYFKGLGIYNMISPIRERCQKTFIIYVTDGLPSVNEAGTAAAADSLMPAVLAKIDALRNLTTSVRGKDYTFDIKTYVLGVGLSDEAKLKLDQMAVHGGADIYGKAYYADNPEQLNTALENVFSNIIDHSYSFTSPSVPSVRMVDKDVLYISSFIPEEKSPLWVGTLKAFQLDSDGTLPVDAAGNPINSPLWDAGVRLKGVSPDARTIYTYARGAMRDFTSASITKEDLGVTTDATRDAVINSVRGNVQDAYDIDHDENTTEQRPWKLGDIFHSNTVIVGSPSPYYNDQGFDGTGGFYENNKDRTKVVIVGANDGLLHAFNATTGDEEWAFIPKTLLTNLKAMMSNHTYYVDSTPKVSDVWFYSSDLDTTKSADEWKTVLVCGLRKGGKHYFALDITDTLNPQYLWEFPHFGDPKISNYSDFLNSTLGQSWSEPAIGKVRIKPGSNSLDRSVAFIGGGFDPTESISNNASVGKAFFVVDIKTGEIIKEFSGLPLMTHCFAAPPTAVDINSDGYIDKVYIGDLGGLMWVFDVSSDRVTDWTGKVLFRPPAGPAEKHMIYYQPAVAFDKYRVPWVYFGTGNREDPNEFNNPPERFYAVKDDGLGNYPRTEGELANVTSAPQNTFAVDPAKKGWYLELYKSMQSLEKVLAKPTLFNGIVYFTTYKNVDIDDPCSGSGVSSLYALEYRSGGGALTVDDLTDLSGPAGDRSKEIGIGAPSTPVISANVNAQGSVIIGTTSGQIFSQHAFSPSSAKVLLYWRQVVP